MYTVFLHHEVIFIYFIVEYGIVLIIIIIVTCRSYLLELQN